MTTRIQLRRGTSTAWTTDNPVLALGEAGIETNTQLWKVGDGTTAWNSLPYMSGGGGTPTHIQDGTTTVAIDGPSGNVYIQVDDNPIWTFDTNSTFTAPGTIIAQELDAGDYTNGTPGDAYFHSNVSGTTIGVTAAGGITVANTGISIGSTGTVAITPNSADGLTWSFTDGGSNVSLLTAPQSDDANIGGIILPGAAGQGFIGWIGANPDSDTQFANTLFIDSSNTVTIGTNFGMGLGNVGWVFDPTGNLTLPAGAVISDTNADGIGLTVANPPVSITLSGADHAPCNGTYTQVVGYQQSGLPTWYKSGDYTSQQYIVYNSGANQWQAVTTDINTNPIYINTGSEYFPLAQWAPGYSGGPYPTGTYTYSNPAWTFDTAGNLTLPGNTSSINYANGQPYGGNGGSGNSNTIFNGTSNVSIPTASANVLINIQGNAGTKTWNFDSTGDLTIPDNGTISVNSGNLYLIPDNTGAVVIQTAGVSNVLLNLQSLAANSQNRMQIDTFGNGLGLNGGGTFIGSYLRPSGAMQNGDRLAQFGGRGSFDGVNLQPGAPAGHIDIKADAPWTANNTPTRIAFWNTQVGSSSPTQTAQLTSNGNLQIFQGNVIVSSGAGYFVGELDTGNTALQAGIYGYTSLGSNVVAQFSANVDNYAQINFQNISSGNSASTDYILTADNGTDSTYYLDLGMNGSNHYDPVFFGDTTTANDGYLYVTGASETGPGDGAAGNLILGSTNGVVKLFVGNTAQANVVTTLSTTGMEVNGNITTTGTTGNITGANVISAQTYTSPGNVTIASSNTTILFDSYDNMYFSFAGNSLGSIGFDATTDFYISPNGNTFIQSALGVNGNISTTGNIIGAYLYGNGSNITGLPATYGNANVATFLANFGANNFSSTGNITANNVSAGTYTNSNANVLITTTVSGDTSTITFDQYNDIYFAWNGNSVGSIGFDATSDFYISPSGNTIIQSLLSVTGSINTSANVTGGNLISGRVVGTGNLHLQPDPSNSSAYLDVYLTSGPDVHIAGNGENLILGGDSTANVTVNTVGNVTIQSWNGSAHTWNFGNDGSMTAPGSVTATAFDVGSSTVYEDTSLILQGGTSISITSPNDTTVTAASENFVFDTGGNLTVPSTLNASSVFTSGSGGDIAMTGGNITGANIITANGVSSTANVTLTSNGNSWVFRSNGNITFPDSSVQTTAYQTVRSGFNAVNPIVQMDNVQFALDNSGNPTVAAVSGTWSGPYTIQAQLWNGSNYPLTTFGSNAATWTSIAGYGFGVTFANAGDQVVGYFTNTDAGHIYKTTWIASPSGAASGYGFIQVERLV